MSNETTELIIIVAATLLIGSVLVHFLNKDID